MNLKTNAWYVRWFFWSLGIVDAFFYKDFSRYSPNRVKENGTNLCFFVQCNLLYAPLVLALNAAAYLGALVVLTATPIYLFGFVTYLWILGIIGALILMIYLGIKLHHYWIERPDKVNESKREPGFGTVLWAWYVAQKKRVCPLVQFSKVQEEAK